MEQTYNVTQAAKILNRTVKCLQLWDRQNKLTSFRTATNRRYYTEEQLNKFLNKKELSIPKIKENIIYCRVSSVNQKQDLKNQKSILETYCLNLGIKNPIFIEEIGGGLNFKRKQFLNIVDKINNGNVEKLIIAHKDRFSRFGFELIQHLCEKNNTEIIILNNESISPEQEMVNDLMTIIHCFSSRLYGLRNYKKSLKKAIENK